MISHGVSHALSIGQASEVHKARKVVPPPDMAWLLVAEGGEAEVWGVASGGWMLGDMRFQQGMVISWEEWADCWQVGDFE